MDLIAPVGTGNAASTASKASDDKSLIAEGQDRFIKLLVAQLKNQDPLAPMDNAQFTAQLAQISTVQGIEKLNVVMSDVLGAINAGQQLQAFGLVGRQALIAGDALALADGKAAGGFRLAEAADVVKVSIVDASDSVVREIDLGSQPAGSGTFTWDGRSKTGSALAAGTYRFRIEAASGGIPVTAETMTAARITAATVGSTGVNLTVGGNSIPLGEIGQII